MENGFDFHWSMPLWFLAAIAYFEIMRRLDRYWAKRTPLTDEERLWNHARRQAISEHEVFKLAAQTWSIGPQTADADFADYLKTGVLPHYVRDYLRKVAR
jgi:hypothetical protein